MKEAKAACFEFWVSVATCWSSALGSGIEVRVRQCINSMGPGGSTSQAVMSDLLEQVWSFLP